MSSVFCPCLGTGVSRPQKDPSHLLFVYLFIWALHRLPTPGPSFGPVHYHGVTHSVDTLRCERVSTNLFSFFFAYLDYNCYIH